MEVLGSWCDGGKEAVGDGVLALSLCAELESTWRVAL